MVLEEYKNRYLHMYIPKYTLFLSKEHLHHYCGLRPNPSKWETYKTQNKLSIQFILIHAFKHGFMNTYQCLHSDNSTSLDPNSVLQCRAKIRRAARLWILRSLSKTRNQQFDWQFLQFRKEKKWLTNLKFWTFDNRITQNIKLWTFSWKVKREDNQQIVKARERSF